MIDTHQKPAAEKNARMLPSLVEGQLAPEPAPVNAFRSMG
jgi:hypothetical protein